MKRMSALVILVVAPLLTAALWMDRQPSYKPYETPVSAPPAGSVPVSGRETVPPEGELRNPVAPAAASLAQGQALFTINCAMCHGQTSARPGPVGARLKPPPPGLGRDFLAERSDAHLFKTISLGFGRMPPFQDRLSPRERWDLVNFLRKNRN